MEKVKEDKVRLEKELLAALLEREEQINKLRGETQEMGHKLDELKKETERRDIRSSGVAVPELNDYDDDDEGGGGGTTQSEEEQEEKEGSRKNEAQDNDVEGEETKEETDVTEPEQTQEEDEIVAEVTTQLENATVEETPLPEDKVESSDEGGKESSAGPSPEDKVESSDEGERRVVLTHHLRIG